jgi:hypothetical protein
MGAKPPCWTVSQHARCPAATLCWWIRVSSEGAVEWGARGLEPAFWPRAPSCAPSHLLSSSVVHRQQLGSEGAWIELCFSPAVWSWISGFTFLSLCFLLRGE